MTVAWVEVGWRGRPVQIEHAWLGADGAAGATLPLVVFLHEGLGSLAMWKDFPAQLCAALGWRGLVYSRPGYGRSTPREAGEHWAPDFMHQQAHEVLPALLQALQVEVAARPPWLFGHSDGASIALLHAAAQPVAGVVVVAPHLFVEEVSLASIAQARRAYTEGGLKAGLAKYHADPDSAFYGWNDVWLSPAFRGWNIEAELAGIRAPLLAVQGVDDEYGTLAQIRNIALHLPQARLLELPACGHSPHRDQAPALLAAVTAFMHEHSPS
jgi:pimeloyl-ACP methyl ester carboxylesterase